MTFEELEKQHKPQLVNPGPTQKQRKLFGKLLDHLSIDEPDWVGMANDEFKIEVERFDELTIHQASWLLSEMIEEAGDQDDYYNDYF